MRSEEHTSELQSHSEISYAVFCLKKKKESINFADSKIVSTTSVTYNKRIPIDEPVLYSVFFFNDTATTEIYTLSYTLSLHDALPIFCPALTWSPSLRRRPCS